MAGTVYVTHCVDTEGPLFESLEATFNRLRDAFDIQLPPTEENLRKLQNKDIEIEGTDPNAVQKFVAPKHIQTNESWHDIIEQLQKITSEDFRSQYEDDEGRGWRFSWFVMDHVGFTGKNPRRRALGYHTVYDQYRRHLEKRERKLDDIYWHYHPLSIRKDAHRCGTSYVNSGNIYDILTRKVIERSWFPVAFRPGFHTERPDSHWFLEQWIPFDFGNQSGKSADDQPDMAGGRFGTWQRAPTEWTPYQPAYEDYQSRGNCQRYIARCLNMDTRHRNITKSDIRAAFREADETGTALLSFVDHDHRDMAAHVDKLWNMITDVNSEFDEVEFRHATGVQAMREVLGIGPATAPELKLELKTTTQEKSPVLRVTTENQIFGTQPFLAIKTKSGNYHWQNFDFPEAGVWTFTFDFHTLSIDAIETVGVAANSPSGVTEVITYDPERKHKDRTRWHMQT